MTDERPGMVRDPIPEAVPDGQYRRPGEEQPQLPREPLEDAGESLDLPEDDREPGDLVPEPAF